MAPQAVFTKDEKVLCFHQELLYEANVLDIRQENDDKKSPFEYKVHYRGWKKTWDHWVSQDRLKKFTEDNQKLAKSLKEEMDSQRNANKPTPKVTTNAKKKGDSSNRPSEERGLALGKKRGRDFDTEKEDAYYQKPAVRVIIPDTLKSILVDDWENVTKNQQLVHLPAKYSVNTILDDFLQQELPKRAPNSSSANILDEVIAGLKEYFNKSLGRLLLYRFERGQYEDILAQINKPGNDLEGRQIADIYGAEHLLRLFVSLPELIAQTNMDQQSAGHLRKELNDFTSWMSRQDSIAKYLSTPYENQTTEYKDRLDEIFEFEEGSRVARVKSTSSETARKSNTTQRPAPRVRTSPPRKMQKKVADDDADTSQLIQAPKRPAGRSKLNVANKKQKPKTDSPHLISSQSSTSDEPLVSEHDKQAEKKARASSRKTPVTIEEDELLESVTQIVPKGKRKIDQSILEDIPVAATESSTHEANIQLPLASSSKKRKRSEVVQSQDLDHGIHQMAKSSKQKSLQANKKQKIADPDIEDDTSTVVNGQLNAKNSSTAIRSKNKAPKKVTSLEIAKSDTTTISSPRSSSGSHKMEKEPKMNGSVKPRPKKSTPATTSRSAEKSKRPSRAAAKASTKIYDILDSDSELNDLEELV